MDEYNSGENRISTEFINSRSSRHTDHRIGRYNSQIQFWLTCLGSAVGYGNIWRFPSVMYRNGGGVFFIPFIIGILIVCLPFYYLEVAYGQLYRKTMHRYFYFGKGKERYQGLSLGIGMILFYHTTLYLGVLVWCFTFLIYSFQSPLPWGVSEEEYELGIFWKQDYFKKDFLNMTEDIFSISNHPLWIMISFIACAVLTFTTVFQGMDTSKYAVFVIIPIPYIIMTILFVKGLFLEGNTIGWKFIFSGDWEKLFTLQIWRDAVGQVLFSSGIGVNLTIHFSSLNPRRQKILPPAIVLPGMNFLTSVFAASTLFAYVGHASLKSGVDISDMPIEGQELAFVAYPAIINTFPLAQLWSILFFAMLVTIGLGSEYAFFDSGTTILYGFLNRMEWFTYHKRYISLPVMLLILSISLTLFASGAGYYWLELLDLYAVNLTPIIFLFLQLLLFTHVLPLEELEVKVLQNGEKFPVLFKFILKWVAPVIVFVLILVGIGNEIVNPPEKGGWERVIGISLLMGPLLVTAAVYLKPGKLMYAEELGIEDESDK